MSRARRSLSISFLLAAIAAIAGAADAEVYCAQYWDSRSGSGGGYTFCWLSGSICYDCWDSGSGSTCSNDWSPCDPRPRQEHKMASFETGPNTAVDAQPFRICEVIAPTPALRSDVLF